MGRQTKSEISVRIAETDAMGVVYYGNFLIYFEVARFEHLITNGCTSEEISEFIYNSTIIEVQCTYKLPARALDVLLVEANIMEMSNKSFTFKYKVINKQPNKTR